MANGREIAPLGWSGAGEDSEAEMGSRALARDDGDDETPAGENK